MPKSTENAVNLATQQESYGNNTGLILILNSNQSLRLFIKDIRSWEIVPGKEGVFRWGPLHFLVQKLRIFWNCWSVRTDKGRGGESVRTRGGTNFSRFCANVFMDCPYNIQLYWTDTST